MKKVKSIIIIFISFKITVLVVYLIYKSSPLQLIHFEHLAMEDVAFNDIYYSVRPQTDKTLIKEKEVVLINSGSIPIDSFRLKLAYLISETSRYDPAAIGIDILFEDPKNFYSDSILNAAILNTRNVVLAINGKKVNGNIFECSYYGIANFPSKNSESVREYYTKMTDGKDSLPSLGAVLSKIRDKEIDFKGDIKYLMYSTVGRGFFNVMDKPKDERNNNFPAVEAMDILHRTDTILFGELIKNKVVIIGHLGSNTMENLNDIEDKHRVPTDSTLINRALTMPGAVIHANAVQMFLTRNNMIDINGWVYELISSIILLFYLILFYTFHHKYLLGKLINISIILVSTIPVIFIFGVWFMAMGYHYKVGALFLQIAFLEEFNEIAEGFRNKLHSKKRLYEKLK